MMLLTPLRPSNFDGKSDSGNDFGERQGLLHRLMWICPIIGLIALPAMLWVFGLTLWTALAITFLVTCPAVVAGVLRLARDRTPKPPRTNP